MPTALGFDFGTTNSSLMLARGNGEVAALGIARDGGIEQTVRTALCFWEEFAAHRTTVKSAAGSQAIEQFLLEGSGSRFLQSMKSFVANPSFQGTAIFGTRYSFEDLLDLFFDHLQREARTADIPRRLVVGRPVEFVGGRSDEGLAMLRYERGFSRFGFDEIVFVYEPVAAAFYYAQSLQKPATILVGDFGGGTTDFSLMRFEPRPGGLHAEAIGHAGIGIAGDDFDYRILHHLVLPRLGRGSEYRSMGKILELPPGLFSSFRRWNELSLFRNSRGLRDLKRYIPLAQEPEKLERLIDLVEDEQGYPLYHAVTDAKRRLSFDHSIEFRFAALGGDFAPTVTRTEFEGWIADDLQRIEATLDDLLTRHDIARDAVDAVFLTGGTSFIPAIRALVARRFGADKIVTGDEHVSIAKGLALIGATQDLDKWSVKPDGEKA
ncbi:MAG: Hsp70 family protein [Candidatus Andeanibacterium colombiense]|uniref:Hsp70 family protein n=1 Tax=Candidatus Andeanibacterium colombiense TaxID=3121345 RepID=A0AAJ5X3X1_9SPHN|nr:MAG: Hsp70 family protein [Sphingomonadaceae bacterium]